MGAEVSESGVHFRVWAPRSKSAEVVLFASESAADGAAYPLEAEGDGYFSGTATEAETGSLYRFRLDSGLFPDPASRFQPAGPHGPSQVVDSADFAWTDALWKGVGTEGQVLYEMHIGTFTAEGTWRAATEHLPYLAELGITILEVMPVADFPGRFGWGYDGVNLFAPTRLYGTPDDFRLFVNRAHELGLGVILDVVYNHFGPDGCCLREFSPDYFSTKWKNEWGDPINFDGKNSGPVREYFLANAGYWIEEFHLDGLRLDATQQIFDDSPKNILGELAARVREAGRGRSTYLVGENEPQDVQLIRPAAEGGYAMDSLWNDDFHHSAVVALTGRNEAYYSDYHGAPQEFVSMVKRGFLYQGQRYKWQKKRRGTASLHLHPAHFVTFLQNHDQVANSLRGRRIHELAAPGAYRALSALFLLGPNTPMLFQGQEFAASSPFFYFADHHPELARAVSAGRQEFLRQFPSVSSLASELAKIVAAPERAETFEQCKLDHGERESHGAILRLHADLLRLRRTDPVFRQPRRGGVDGAVLGLEAFVLRFFGEEGDDRLLLVNLGKDLPVDPAPEPLLAPPEGCDWELLWLSEDPVYGGNGAAPLESEENWRIPGGAAAVLCPRRDS